MTWPDWVIIASIALLAGAIIGARRRQWRSLRQFGFLFRKRGSPGAYEKGGSAVAPHSARAERYSTKEAITDGLTGLKTHRQFREALDRERRWSARTGQPFSLIMVGLDRFEQVDDRMGRVGSDKVLKAVAALLDARSRQSNLVARYGAHEFAILMPETNTQQAEVLAKRLRAAVEVDHLLRAREVTISFGIATFPDHGETPEQILKVAESGMYLAQHCEGNCVKVASSSIAAGDAEREQDLLEVYLEAAVKPMFHEASSRYRHSSEPSKPLLDTITALAFAVEAKGPYAKGHSQTVSRLAARMALQAGLPQAEIEKIYLAGLVHDIGKLRVPEHVLRKPAPLTAEEFEIMKSHAACGAQMLESLNAKSVERIVRHHHERYDGRGYPDGLAGDGIPLGARIVAVAESFHNMVSTLRYKSTLTFRDAFAELRRCSGTQFDPQVVTAFFDLGKIHGAHSMPQWQGEATLSTLVQDQRSSLP